MAPFISFTINLAGTMLRKLLLHVEVAFYFSLKMHLNSSFSSFLSSRAVAGIKGGVGMIKNGFNAHVIMWKKEDLKKRAQHHHKKWLLSFYIGYHGGWVIMVANIELF